MKPCNGVASARWRRAKRRCNSDVTQKAEYNKRDKDQRKGQGESKSWGTRIKEWGIKRMTLKGNGLTTAQLENLATSRGEDISRGNDNTFIWVTSTLTLKYGVFLSRLRKISELKTLQLGCLSGKKIQNRKIKL